jgi:hypothetical protein
MDTHLLSRSSEQQHRASHEETPQKDHLHPLMNLSLFPNQRAILVTYPASDTCPATHP